MNNDPYLVHPAPRVRHWAMARMLDRGLALNFGTMLLVALVALVPNQSVRALTTDRDQPINIEADWAEADDTKGVTVYKGKVVIVQGSLRISGDVVTMYFDEARELERMIAVGQLARFRQKADGADVFQRAKAQRIQYNLATDTMVLTGEAQLSKGADFIRANRIVYDTLNARIKGESQIASNGSDSAGKPSGGGRVKIVLTPKKLCTDGVRRAKCP
ncbi:MAG: lipopolysaccharide export system protein LptA [Gammaproteobacteria bacterium]|jgi:lipopolysaccharide export system protein LptA